MSRAPLAPLEERFPVTTLADEPALWITGVGMVTPLGADAPSSIARLFAGERGISELSLFELPGARSRLAAEVRCLDLTGEAARADAMAIHAAREALTGAGCDNLPIDKRVPIDLIVGGTTAGMFETEQLLTEQHLLNAEAGLGADLDRRLKTHPLSSTADRVAEVLGPFRMVRTVCCACTSGAAALALAAAWIRSGQSERVLAGGVDALCRLTVSGFGSLAVLDPAPCRPFDKTRAGLNLGEGAGFLLVERADAASRRGAKPIIELSGWALAGEAHHITNPDPTGQAADRMLKQALRVSKHDRNEIGYVNAHGTATPHNDAAEARALRVFFGEQRPLVSSSKGQLGHTLGAAGAIEAIIATQAVLQKRVPPTIGLVEADPACDVDHVRAATSLDRDFVALSTSFGFGGTAGAVLVAKPRARVPRTLGNQPILLSAAAVVAEGRLIDSPAELAQLLLPSGVLATTVERASALGEASPNDPTAVLDAAKTRRMDRPGRLTTLVFEAALARAAAHGEPPPREEMAAISATACGNVDGCMRFVKRVLEKGAQFAMPAEFPNLVPSSPVSHAAIYHKLGGPALATPDLSATAESSLATGLDLVRGEVCRAALTGSVEEVSELADRVLAPLLGARSLAARREGASALLVESSVMLRERGGKPLAAVAAWQSRRGQLDWSVLPAPPAHALVVAEPRVELEALLLGSPWSQVERRALCPSAGDHIGMGGVALAAAAGALAADEASAILVVGAAPERVYAFLLEAC